MFMNLAVEPHKHKNSSNFYYWKFPTKELHFPTVELNLT